MGSSSLRDTTGSIHVGFCQRDLKPRSSRRPFDKNSYGLYLHPYTRQYYSLSMDNRFGYTIRITIRLQRSAWLYLKPSQKVGYCVLCSRREQASRESTGTACRRSQIRNKETIHAESCIVFYNPVLHGSFRSSILNWRQYTGKKSRLQTHLPYSEGEYYWWHCGPSIKSPLCCMHAIENG